MVLIEVLETALHVVLHREAVAVFLEREVAVLVRRGFRPQRGIGTVGQRSASMANRSYFFAFLPLPFPFG
jgi:hypothetical protein